MSKQKSNPFEATADSEMTPPRRAQIGALDVPEPGAGDEPPASELPHLAGAVPLTKGKKAATYRLEDDVHGIIRTVKEIYAAQGYRIANDEIIMDAVRGRWGPVVESWKTKRNG